jgi:energy-coupling factor transport system permease protein
MNAVHPVIRVVSTVVLTGFLSLGNPADTGVIAVLLMLLYSVTSISHAASAWAMLKRLRWFFVSILVVYLWFTPGEPLFFPGIWMPTLEGAMEGGLRILSLAVVVLAVNLLLRTTAQEQLLDAVYRLAYPLRYLGIPHEKLAVRATLTLQFVPQVQQLLEGRSFRPRSVPEAGDAFAAIFRDMAARSEAAMCEFIEISAGEGPPPYQWLFPLLLVVALYWI